MTVHNIFNINKLINTINTSESTSVVIAGINSLDQTKIFELIYNNGKIRFRSLDDMKNNIETILKTNCKLLETITFSNNNVSF